MANIPITINRYTVILEPAEEGGYTVTIPALPGCITEGDTFEQAIAMARDAIGGYIQSMIKHGEPISYENAPPITTAIEIELQRNTIPELQTV